MMLSFIIPAHNEAHYIRFLLQSIYQNAKGYDFEIIVVDNASTDNTVEVVRKSYPNVRVISENKKGTGFARNAGAAQAKGDLFIFFDSDVAMPYGWILRMQKHFNMNTHLVALSGPYRYRSFSKWQRFWEWAYYALGVLPHQWFFNSVIKKGGILIGGNLVVKKNAFERIGGFDETFVFWGDDTNLAKRLRKIGELGFFMDIEVASSPRRMMRTGRGATLNSIIGFFAVLSYIANFYSVIFFNRPLLKKHKDVR